MSIPSARGARAAPDTVSAREAVVADTVISLGKHRRRYRQAVSIDRLFGRKVVALGGWKRLSVPLNGRAPRVLRLWINMNLDETDWMDRAKARQFVGIGAGTKRPISVRRHPYAWASMLELTIEWE